MKFYWPVDHYSVPLDTLCFKRDASPNADFFCIREAGHRGKCLFEWSPTIKDYSHRQKPTASPSSSPQSLQEQSRMPDQSK